MRGNDVDSIELQRTFSEAPLGTWGGATPSSGPRKYATARSRRRYQAGNWTISSARILAILALMVGTWLPSRAQSFVSTGNLITGRNAHRAVTLNDGTVLIVGGYNVNENALASSELYSPGTGTFTATGSLNTARRNFGITLLDNGTVLVTGGYDANFNSLASAEIYDPATGIFTFTGSLTTARGDCSATRLNDGTVLIAGGFDTAGNSLASAELYMPSAGTFISTGSLNTARGFSTATALMDGTVLVEGGWAAQASLSSAEVYDPATGVFTNTGSLNIARVRNTATLLNGGNVLIAGGEDSASNALSSAEIYNSAARAFTLTGSLNTARGDHAATLLTNGTVLVEGGFACNPSNCLATEVSMSASAELFDPVAGSFSATGSLFTARQVHTATLLSDGTVLVAGGWSGGAALTSAEVYQPGSFAPPNLVAISTSPANPSIFVGGSQQLVPIGTLTDNTTQVLASVTWSSSNTASVRVTNNAGSNSGVLNDSTNNGVVFGAAAGTSTVSACTGAICGSTIATVVPSASGRSFVLRSSPASRTVSAGGTAAFSLSLMPRGGFSGNVGLSCVGLPIGATCTISPTSLTPSTSKATVTIKTTGSSVAFLKSGFRQRAQFSAATAFGGQTNVSTTTTTLLAVTLVLCFVSTKRRAGSRLVSILLLSTLTSCGGASNPPAPAHTPAGTYTIAVSGTGDGITRSAQLVLIVN